ncbi:hypothetical protein NL676_023041 [Syzygium grande]|nr:hypothetical protein NL676_023041 [Syzygium grande]
MAELQLGRQRLELRPNGAKTERIFYGLTMPLFFNDRKGSVQCSIEGYIARLEVEAANKTKQHQQWQMVVVFVQPPAHLPFLRDDTWLCAIS